MIKSVAPSLYAVIIKIGVSTSCFGGEVEETEAVAHEVREGVTHFEAMAEGHPGFGVAAPEEGGFVSAIPEVASDF